MLTNTDEHYGGKWKFSFFSLFSRSHDNEFPHFHFIFDLHNADTTCESFQISTIHVVCLVFSLVLYNKCKTWQILLEFRIFKVFTICCSFLSRITDELLVRTRKTSSMSSNQEKERVQNIFIKRLIMTACYCRFVDSHKKRILTAEIIARWSWNFCWNSTAHNFSRHCSCSLWRVDTTLRCCADVRC